MKRNFWENNFRNVARDWGQQNIWEEYIKEHKDRKYALRLLAIAYLESLNDEMVEGSYGKYINKKYEIFKPSYFSQNKGVLREQLNEFGVTLLKNGTDYQYLRTILKYSGKMCINIAKRISENVNSWDEEQIKKHLDVFKKQFELPNSEDQAFEDAENIFLTIAEQYRRNNLPPTLEELWDLPIDLTDNVISRIYDILFSDREKQFETRPVVDIESKGKAVFLFPEEGAFRKEIKRAVFEFKFSGNRKTVFEYQKNNGKWIKKCLYADCKTLYVEQTEEINFIWWDNDTTDKHKENVLPDVCNDDLSSLMPITIQ